jgi:hypothetical protein
VNREPPESRGAIPLLIERCGKQPKRLGCRVIRCPKPAGLIRRVCGGLSSPAAAVRARVTSPTKTHHRGQATPIL